MRHRAVTTLACAVISCVGLLAPAARADVVYSTSFSYVITPPSLGLTYTVPNAQLPASNVDINLGAYEFGHDFYDFLGSFRIQNNITVFIRDTSDPFPIVEVFLPVTVTGTVQFGPPPNGFATNVSITETVGPPQTVSFEGILYTFTPDAYSYSVIPSPFSELLVGVPFTASLSVVPEPASALLLVPGAAFAYLATRRSARRRRAGSD